MPATWDTSGPILYRISYANVSYFQVHVYLGIQLRTDTYLRQLYKIAQLFQLQTPPRNTLQSFAIPLFEIDVTTALYFPEEVLHAGFHSATRSSPFNIARGREAHRRPALRGPARGTSGLPYVTQKLVFSHLVAAFLPLFPQLLQ